MSITNIYEAKSQLSKLIEKAESGEEVIIARGGKPVAKLVAYKADERTRQGGQWNGRVKISADFDALPEEIAEAFGLSNADSKQKGNK
jgi:prevent-host-death family protein